MADRHTQWSALIVTVGKVGARMFISCEDGDDGTA
jgi:hypothetical protein